MILFTNKPRQIKTVYLSESQVMTLLRESQESKSIDAAKKLLMQHGYSNEKADEIVRINLRNDLPILRTKEGGKFILGATRMFLQRELNSAQIINNLNATLKYVASDAHINEYDRNLNGLSAQELIDRFSKAIAADIESERKELGNAEYTSNSDYTIMPINSFKESSRYGDYTDWCVTHDASMFDSYTSDGINQFYFCFKKGFENTPREQGNGCPLDEYGLSMIAVCVNENGALSTCTCRWNHDNGGNDHIMNTKQISQLIGQNFYEVFKPNNKWQEAMANLQARLASNEDLESIFDGFGEVDNGLAIIEYEDRQNLINIKKREILSKEWFEFIEYYKETPQFIVARVNNGYNIYDATKRQFILKQNYSGIAIADINGIMGDKGKILYRVKVKGDRLFNIVDNEGNVYFPQDVRGYRKQETANIPYLVVTLQDHSLNIADMENRSFMLNIQGIRSISYSYVKDFLHIGMNNGGAREEYIFDLSTHRIINKEPLNIVQVLDRWAFTVLQSNGRKRIMNMNGEYISDMAFDYVTKLAPGIYNIVMNDKDGTPLFDFIDWNGERGFNKFLPYRAFRALIKARRK